MLPSMVPLKIGCPSGKKQKQEVRPLLPCPQELYYANNEMLNMNSDDRVQGSSSHFFPKPLEILPLSNPLYNHNHPASHEVLDKFKASDKTPASTDNVLKELYRSDGFAYEDTSQSYSDLAFRRTFNNTHLPQYYLKTTTAETTTVTHMAHDRFWGRRELQDRKADAPINLGAPAYTHGFVWCNTYPNWTYNPRGKLKLLIRCRIYLPKGTQVVVDRSPVYGDSGPECQFDDDRTSLFPDVLLPPAEFKIVSVQRYRSTTSTAVEADGEDVTAIKPQMHKLRYDVLTDEQYAQHVFESYGADRLVDVCLKVTRMMQLPPQSTAVAPVAPVAPDQGDASAG